MALLHPGPRPGRTRDDTPAPTLVRVLAVAALAPLLTGYAAVAAVLAVVTASAAGAGFSTSGVLAAAVPGWLAAHQVPLVIEGRELGALPLLPTALAALLVWRTAAAAAERLGVDGPRTAGWIVGVIAGAHAGLGLALALLSSSSPAQVDPLAGLYYPALVSGAAAVVGVLPRSGLLDLARESVDPLARSGLRAGLIAVAALLAVGAGLVVVALLGSFGTVRYLFGLQDTGGGLGMLLLSLGYLPNAVVAATGFTAGPGFSMGEVVVSALDFHGGPIPGLPLLGALPEDGATWWLALCVLPALVGVFIGWSLRAVAVAPTTRLRAVAVAAVVVAMAFAVLGGAAGGSLGGGPFHPLDLRAAWLSLALVCWVGIPGAVMAWTAGPRAVPAVVTVAEPALDTEDEPDEVEDSEDSNTSEDDAARADDEDTEDSTTDDQSADEDAGDVDDGDTADTAHPKDEKTDDTDDGRDTASGR
ncbi:cell division protein PerM [Actinokineospora pegani]|uniref:cell division protein PerM n=1 Tax=Actinokineospora pegani TaxID=2654637 RepID=UPI0012EA3D7E|nr:DUF6350 family protein [Actinokineospora pegani]